MKVRATSIHLTVVLPWKETPARIKQDAGWVRGPEWMLGEERHLVHLLGVEPQFLSCTACSQLSCAGSEKW